MKTKCKTISTYREIIDTHINCYDYKCFFAFSISQFYEGREKAGIAGEKIYSADGSLFGTREGITSYYKAIDDNSKRVSLECDPQDVYDYEFANHECGYTGDDFEAIKLVTAYFSEDVAKTIKRRCAFVEIDDLFKKNNKEA